VPPNAGKAAHPRGLVLNRPMDERELGEFELLVQVLDEELGAQFGVNRAHGTDEERHRFAALLADAVFARFSVVDRLTQ
jgi:hypothetical protein